MANGDARASPAASESVPGLRVPESGGARDPELLAEPERGQTGHFLEGSGLGEEVGGAGDDVAGSLEALQGDDS